MRSEICGFALAVTCLSGCGFQKDNDAKNTPEAMALVESESLLFATIDRLSSPWRAAIFDLDLAQFENKRLLTGESGDPAFFKTADEIFLFNRSQDSRNFRRLTRSSERSFQVDTQKSFPGGEFGDPHDALDLGEGRLLLAHYTEGALVVTDKVSGQELSRIAGDWDLPDGVPLKPEALVAYRRDQSNLIYVVHQALSLEGGLISANGSQQVFILEQEGPNIKVVDLDPNTPRVQGIRVKGSFPVPVRFQRRDKLLLVSMCSRYVAMGSALMGRPCDAAVEEIDPSNQQVTTLWDLNGSPYFMNGPVSPGPAPHQFFANIDLKGDDASFSQVVGLFDATARTFQKTYSFAKDSGGFWSSVFDEAGKTLFIGDVNEQSGGQYTVMPIGRDGETKVINLEGAPYAAVLVPRR